jgi:hypothetical protein
LTGDYSHTKKALDKALAYFRSKYIKPDTSFSHIEVFAIGKKEINNPSKWTTEIYYPIKQRVVAKPTEIIPQTTEEVAPKPPVEKEIPSEF